MHTNNSWDLLRIISGFNTSRFFFYGTTWLPKFNVMNALVFVLPPSKEEVSPETYDYRHIFSQESLETSVQRETCPRSKVFVGWFESEWWVFFFHSVMVKMSYLCMHSACFLTKQRASTRRIIPIVSNHRPSPFITYLYIWVNYNDLTATSLES